MAELDVCGHAAGPGWCAGAVRRLRASVSVLVAAVLVAVAVVVCVPAPAVAAGGSATDWMSQRKWGVSLQYFAENTAPHWPADSAGMPSAAEWNDRVDGFDVPGLVRQLKSVGAGWLLMSAGQTSGFYDAPNPVYEGLVPATAAHPSRLSQRDLIKDLGVALRGTGIKLMVYFGADGPSRDPYAMSHLGGSYDQPAFQANFTKIVRQWSQQWGDLVSGWWVDAGWLAYHAYYDGLIDAMHAGNPQAVVALNPGEGHFGTVSDKQDFTAGEANPERWPLRPASRFLTSNGVQTQVHYLTPAQTWWGDPPTAPMSFSTSTLINYTQNVNNVGAAVTWDVGFNRANGHISAAAMFQLRELGAATTLPVTLYRCYNPGNGDHMDTTNPGCEQSSYRMDALLWGLYRTQVPGTVPLYRCYNPGNGDHMDTTNPGCEGYPQRDGVLGYFFPTQNADTVPLYRCYNPGNGDHMTTFIFNCEGYSQSDGILGYAIT